MQTNSTGGVKTRSFGGSFWGKPTTTEEVATEAPTRAQGEEPAVEDGESLRQTAPTPHVDEPSEHPIKAIELPPTTEPQETEHAGPNTGENDAPQVTADEQTLPAVEDEPVPEAETAPATGPEPGDGQEPPSEPEPEDAHEAEAELTADVEPEPEHVSPAASKPPKRLPVANKPAPERRDSQGSAPRTPAPAPARTSQQAPQAYPKPDSNPKPRAKQAPQIRIPAFKKPKPAPAKPLPKKPSRWDKYPIVRKTKWLFTAHRIPAITITSIVVSVIVIYVTGGIFFSRHFLPHTTVNGNDVSLLTSGTFANRINSEVQGYTAHITGDGVDLSVAGSDVDLKLDTETYVKAATSQLPAWAWPFILLSDHNYTVSEGVSLDESKVKELVSAAAAKVNQDPTPTTNATFAFDPDIGDFSAIKEAIGTEIDIDAAAKKVAINMQGLTPAIVLGEEELVQPNVKVSDPQFQDAMTQARNFPDQAIDLLLGSDVATTLEPTLIRSWLILGDGYTVTGDLDAISAYTRGTLSAQLDTVAAYRTYTRPDGKKIQINDGTYGWNIDGSKLAEIIVERINKQSFDPIEIPCNSTAAVYNPGGADWGDRYIDVDLTEQYARMYVGGDQVWGSECVSGGPASGNDTVTGVFAIEGKESPMKLIGLDSNGDGKPDYENDVTFWMPFFGGYGLHDATWRYTFGGQEYLNDGSHGCVNLPYDAAEALYYEVEVGDPVIVHW